MLTFPDHRHQHINRDGNPDLGLDGVLRGAEEDLDAQMLLDPFEKQLDRACAALRNELPEGTRIVCRLFKSVTSR